ncbi:hypothetical protein QV01_07585 [Gallibacterium genomosp. 3]|uniref:Uncharacterized protein n=1 Tax=Gallibacterium genomosp. 3 TaxID=505345 RepID=A0A1A7NMK3_9PAST|nr:hypothetical protein [Gallibacterium genomosp. 3]OBW91362.1 hypothetical protein QV01_07585 [Gallibacterium genomosp. 3]
MSFEIFTDYGTASKSTITLRESGLLFISNSIIENFTGVKAQEVFGYMIFTDKNKRELGLFLMNSKEVIEKTKKYSTDAIRTISKSNRKDTGVLINISPPLRSLGYTANSYKKANLNYSEHEKYDIGKLIVINVANLIKK